MREPEKAWHEMRHKLQKAFLTHVDTKQLFNSNVSCTVPKAEEEIFKTEFKAEQNNEDDRK